MGEKKVERERKEEMERHVEKEKGRLEKNRRTEERKENADIYMTASKCNLSSCSFFMSSGCTN